MFIFIYQYVFFVAEIHKYLHWGMKMCKRKMVRSKCIRGLTKQCIRAPTCVLLLMRKNQEEIQKYSGKTPKFPGRNPKNG